MLGGQKGFGEREETTKKLRYEEWKLQERGRKTAKFSFRFK